MKPLKKIDYRDYSNGKHQVQSYLKDLQIYQARLKFKINSKMTPTVQMNFQSDQNFANQLWTCSGCSSVTADGQLAGSRDTQSHIIICKGYQEMRQDLDFNKDKDLVKYFDMVIKERLDKLE